MTEAFLREFLKQVEVLWDRTEGARDAVDAERRLADQLRLPLLRDPVGARLVAVLGQPDPLRAERTAHLGEQPLERRHRDRGAVAARPVGERRLPARRRIRMVRVDVGSVAGDALASCGASRDPWNPLMRLMR